MLKYNNGLGEVFWNTVGYVKRLCTTFQFSGWANGNGNGLCGHGSREPLKCPDSFLGLGVLAASSGRDTNQRFRAIDNRHVPRFANSNPAPLYDGL